MAFAGIYHLWIVLIGVSLLGISLGVREPLLMSTIRSLIDTSAVAGAVRVRSAIISPVPLVSTGPLLILGTAMCVCAVIASQDKAIARSLNPPDEDLDFGTPTPPTEKVPR
ncbi:MULTISPECIES: hypothetical protein [unclassified Streptomyces]|uniref:hypothetical protein n=1 Tax=unclassified Streptomyces TaxID=2593676 RepID=UPI002E1029AC|nr:MULTISPECIES: hypothetical protein [unclassified Streptomyces]WSR29147.1 hypothetical protein OG573_41950 [Streptomyces sp. NBC_01205]